MVPSLVLTWSTLTTQLAAASWPLLAPIARTYYAQQGRLVTAANYLNLPPAAAAEPFIGNAAASQLVSAILPTAGPADETYAQYVLRGADYAQPLLTQLTTVLQEQAITLASFTQQMATPDSSGYLTTLLGLSFWIPVTANWQQQLQRQLDTQGRWQRLLATQQDPILQALLVNLSTRLAGFYPTGSLNTASDLPLNELARVLWTPAPLADEQVVTQLLGSLQTAAQVVLAQNYPDSELTARLVATVASGLAPLTQLLLLDPEGKTAVTTVAELATAELGTLASRIVLLPANHPLVYALAAWVRDALQDFLQTENPAALIPASFLPVRGQLLGADDKPLADFVVRTVQILNSQEGVIRSLGELRTDADGRFTFNVSRDLYLDDNDVVVEVSANLRAAVYYPGQAATGEPAQTLVLTTGSEEVAYPTSLLSVVPAPASQVIDKFSLPTVLSELLTERGITSLADVRAAGGIRQLVAGTDDLELLLAARRLDGLAQFEVVSGDTAFHKLVIAAGFYSPSQLLDTTSPEEFVQRLTLADAPAELRSQAQTFYQQAAATQSLSHALGLLVAGAQASGTVPTSEPTAILNDARYRLAAMADSAGSTEAETVTRDGVEGQEVEAKVKKWRLTTASMPSDWCRGYR